MDNTAAEYRATWDALTEAQRKILKRLRRREESPQFEFLSHEGMHKNAILALKSKRLADYVNGVLKLTELGRAVVEASQATPDNADAEVARLRAQNAALREALGDIAKHAPDEKPIEDPDYGWDTLVDSRELSIASANYTLGGDQAMWRIGEIARAALKRAAEALREDE